MPIYLVGIEVSGPALKMPNCHSSLKAGQVIKKKKKKKITMGEVVEEKISVSSASLQKGAKRKKNG